MKRPRQEINHTQPSVSMDTVVMPMVRRAQPTPTVTPSYPPVLTSSSSSSARTPLSPLDAPPAHPSPRTPTLISGGHTSSHVLQSVAMGTPGSRKQLLAEDWSYIDMVSWQLGITDISPSVKPCFILSLFSFFLFLFLILSSPVEIDAE